MEKLIERKNLMYWDNETHERSYPVYMVDEYGVYHFHHHEPLVGERTFRFRGRTRWYSVCEILSKAEMAFHSYNDYEVTVFGEDDCNKLQNALEQAGIWFKVKGA